MRLFLIMIFALIFDLVYLFARLSESGDSSVDLCLEALFLFNQLEQDFGTVKFDLDPD